MRYIVQSAYSFIAAAIVALLEALAIDFEVAGVTLLVSAFLLPSIATFSLIDWSKWGAGPTKHVVFWLSLLPISLTMLIGAFTSREGSHLAAAILFWYIFQAIAAYVVLMLMSLRIRYRSRCAASSG